MGNEQIKELFTLCKEFGVAEAQMRYTKNRAFLSSVKFFAEEKREENSAHLSDGSQLPTEQELLLAATGDTSPIAEPRLPFGNKPLIQEEMGGP